MLNSVSLGWVFDDSDVSDANLRVRAVGEPIKYHICRIFLWGRLGELRAGGCGRAMPRGALVLEPERYGQCEPYSHGLAVGFARDEVGKCLDHADGFAV